MSSDNTQPQGTPAPADETKVEGNAAAPVEATKPETAAAQTTELTTAEPVTGASPSPAPPPLVAESATVNSTGPTHIVAQNVTVQGAAPAVELPSRRLIVAAKRKLRESLGEPVRPLLFRSEISALMAALGMKAEDELAFATHLRKEGLLRKADVAKPATLTDEKSDEPASPPQPPVEETTASAPPAAAAATEVAASEPTPASPPAVDPLTLLMTQTINVIASEPGAKVVTDKLVLEVKGAEVPPTKEPELVITDVGGPSAADVDPIVVETPSSDAGASPVVSLDEDLVDEDEDDIIVEEPVATGSAGASPTAGTGAEIDDDSDDEDEDDIVVEEPVATGSAGASPAAGTGAEIDDDSDDEEDDEEEDDLDEAARAEDDGELDREEGLDAGDLDDDLDAEERRAARHSTGGPLAGPGWTFSWPEFGPVARIGSLVALMAVIVAIAVYVSQPKTSSSPSDGSYANFRQQVVGEADKAYQAAFASWKKDKVTQAKKTLSYVEFKRSMLPDDEAKRWTDAEAKAFAGAVEDPYEGRFERNAENEFHVFMAWATRFYGLEGDQPITPIMVHNWLRFRDLVALRAEMPELFRKGDGETVQAVLTRRGVSGPWSNPTFTDGKLSKKSWEDSRKIFDDELNKLNQTFAKAT